MMRSTAGLLSPDSRLVWRQACALANSTIQRAFCGASALFLFECAGHSNVVADVLWLWLEGRRFARAAASLAHLRQFDLGLVRHPSPPTCRRASREAMLGASRNGAKAPAYPGRLDATPHLG